MSFNKRKRKNPELLVGTCVSLFFIYWLGCGQGGLQLEGIWSVTEIDINNTVFSRRQAAMYISEIRFGRNRVDFTYGMDWQAFAFGLDATFTYSLDQVEKIITLNDNNIDYRIRYTWDGKELAFHSWSSSLVDVVGGSSPINYIKLSKQ